MNGSTNLTTKTHLFCPTWFPVWSLFYLLAPGGNYQDVLFTKKCSFNKSLPAPQTQAADTDVLSCQPTSSRPGVGRLRQPAAPASFTELWSSSWTRPVKRWRGWQRQSTTAAAASVREETEGCPSAGRARNCARRRDRRTPLQEGLYLSADYRCVSKVWGLKLLFPVFISCRPIFSVCAELWIV